MDVNAAPQFSTAEYEPELKDSNALLARGVLFGVGGALAGLALYATVVIVTNYEIGFVSLAVGWLVGKAMLAGSRGRTGRRYQIAAVLLTYFAVSMATIPIAIAQIIKTNNAGTASAESVTTPAGSGDAAKPAEATGDGESGEASLASVAGTLLFIGLASPFLGLQDMPGGLISLIILGVGLQIAWKLTASRATVSPVVLDEPVEEKPTSLDLNR